MEKCKNMNSRELELSGGGTVQKNKGARFYCFDAAARSARWLISALDFEMFGDSVNCQFLPK